MAILTAPLMAVRVARPIVLSRSQPVRTRMGWQTIFLEAPSLQHSPSFACGHCALCLLVRCCLTVQVHDPLSWPAQSARKALRTACDHLFANPSSVRLTGNLSEALLQAVSGLGLHYAKPLQALWWVRFYLRLDLRASPEVLRLFAIVSQLSSRVYVPGRRLLTGPAHFQLA